MKKLTDAVQKYEKLILDTERFIWKNPETGYKEYKTSKYMADTFKSLGYELVMAEGITGFYTVIDTGRPGPTVLVLGELDSIICPEHPECDPETGAVHSCGHNAQCAALVGVAAALKEPGVLDELSGKIMLCAVPAEELLEIEFRDNLIKEGKIKYMGGKVEFLYRGYFDDVDIAFMIHTSSFFHSSNGGVGCMAKHITYKGKAAHAGGSPWNGINALYAASCGLNAINAIRETFKESDVIRVHPIITAGGSMVNAIPETAVIESSVRGATFEALVEANKKVNRALCGAALSLGANVDIKDIPGYAPNYNSKAMKTLTTDAAKEAIPEYDFQETDYFGSGRTDMGDLSSIMPTIHPYAGGSKGTSHGNDYYIDDPVAACIGSAKLQVGMLYLLLSDGAKRAKEIIDTFEPKFPSKKAYIEYIDSLNRSGDRIEYKDGEAVVKL